MSRVREGIEGREGREGAVTRRNHKDLLAWQRGMEFVTEVYRVTRSMPADERFGLTMQVRRAAVSVPANIAEGHARNGPNEFRHFLGIAKGSLREAETHLQIAINVGLLNNADIVQALDLAAKTAVMLDGLIHSPTKRR